MKRGQDATPNAKFYNVATTAEQQPIALSSVGWIDDAPVIIAIMFATRRADVEIPAGHGMLSGKSALDKQ